MARRVCPWWLGYFLASPVRRWLMQPEWVVAPYIRSGMTVLEPGPGMGFFTLPMARMVGEKGRVIAIDVQQKMIDGLKQRAEKAELLGRVDARLASPGSLRIEDLQNKVDLTLAFAMVHELPDGHPFFREVAVASKADAMLLLVEPSGHVNTAEFDTELQQAVEAGFTVVERPTIRRSHAAVLRKQ